jgi:uncharacterized protein YkwD
MHACMPRGLLALVAAASLLAPPGAASQPAGRARADTAEATRLIVAQTNAFRRSQGLANTTRNAQLDEVARRFAEFMARSDQYGHEADGRTPAQRAKAHGYDYCVVLENIAYQYSSAGFRTADLASRVVDGWERSPGHRRNMLDPDVTEIGVAMVQSPRSSRYYAVQMFGRPRAMHVEFRIANRSNTTLRYELGGEVFRLPPRVTRTHEQCRAEALIVQLPGASEPATVQPVHGDRYAIERTNGRYRLTKS